MTEALCAQKSPYPTELAPGDYYWCACGLSKKQPLCDGSHKTTAITPVKFAVTKTDTYYLCGCKQTGTPPYCDGTHKSLR